MRPCRSGGLSAVRRSSSVKNARASIRSTSSTGERSDGGAVAGARRRGGTPRQWLSGLSVNRSRAQSKSSSSRPETASTHPARCTRRVGDATGVNPFPSRTAWEFGPSSPKAHDPVPVVRAPTDAKTVLKASRIHST